MKAANFIVNVGRFASSSRGAAVQMDVHSLVDSRALLMANSGGGKSWMMRVLAEQIAPRMQIVILDPEGEFGTLREAVDAVLVGPGGDLSTDVRTAPLLARKLMELGVSAVVDLSELSLQERRAFARAFLQSLMSLPKSLWHPCLIFIDEAHRFAPERSSGQSEATDAVITLMSQGRKRGFCGILATQRISKLHKDAAAEANNYLVGRTALDVDVSRARDLLGMGKDGDAMLRSLSPGDWYGFGPAFEHSGVERFRAAKVKTTHPRSGERHKITAPAPSAKIKKVLGELEAIPQETKEHEEEIETLRRENKKLREALCGKQPVAPPSIATSKKKHLAMTSVPSASVKREYDRQVMDLKKLLRANAKITERIALASSQLQSSQEHLEQTVGAMRFPEDDAPSPAPTRTLASNGVDRSTSRRRRRGPPAVSTGIGGGGQARMLAVLAQAEAGCTRTELAIRSGLVSSSGTFAKYLSNLRSDGHIEDRGGRIYATTSGASAIGSVEMPEGDELVQMWGDMLGGGGIRRMFDALVEAADAGLTRSELADAAGLEASSGTFAKYLSTLRAKDLAEGRDPIVISEVLR